MERSRKYDYKGNPSPGLFELLCDGPGCGVHFEFGKMMERCGRVIVLCAMCVATRNFPTMEPRVIRNSVPYTASQVQSDLTLAAPRINAQMNEVMDPIIKPIIDAVLENVGAITLPPAPETVDPREVQT